MEYRIKEIYFVVLVLFVKSFSNFCGPLFKMYFQHKIYGYLHKIKKRCVVFFVLLTRKYFVYNFKYFMYLNINNIKTSSLKYNILYNLSFYSINNYINIICILIWYLYHWSKTDIFVDMILGGKPMETIEKVGIYTLFLDVNIISCTYNPTL